MPGIIDGNVLSVTKLANDVQAAVGVNTWVNFTDQKIDFNPGA